MDTWTCPRCGKTGLTSSTCPTCFTPKPPVFDTHTSSPTPTPQPSPTPMPSPQPSTYKKVRIEKVGEYDGKIEFYDYENDYKIVHNNNGYDAFNSNGSHRYHIDPDGKTYFITDGCVFDVLGKYSIEDIESDMIVTGTDGYDYILNDGKRAKKVTNYDSKNRFYSINNDDGSQKIIDRQYGYDITCSDEGTYVVKEESGRKICSIRPDGLAMVYNKNTDKVILAENTITIDDITPEMYLTDKFGNHYTMSNGFLIKFEYGDSSHVIYYDSKGNESKTIFPNGEIMINTKYINCKLNLDGTYSIRKKDGLEYDVVAGTYSIDKDGNVIFLDNDGEKTYCNDRGEITKKVTKDGKTIDFDVSKDLQTVTRNGKTTYSKINHIEYDEDAYNNILNTLNSVDGKNIKNNCSDVIKNINSFPDKGHALTGINNIKTSVNAHINLVQSLGEMTNFSLLAYQTCDEELRNGLYMLIDSLFGDRDSSLAEQFKNSIKNTIEDRDNDKILEYKEGTNFTTLHDNAIVDSTYVDENGNKWYLSKSKLALGVEGNNIKINYGGKTFNVSVDKNGLMILKDSKGNPLNIFDDYNIESKQFGGNQMDLSSSNDKKDVYDILSKYFPDSTMEERQALLDKATNTGCGYTAIANFIFKNLEGNEGEFYKKFGYPMYNLKYDPNIGVTVDYNYEPVIMDLYCDVNSKSGKYDIRDTTTYGGGVNSKRIEYMTKYVKDKYDISFDDQSGLKYYGDYDYSLYNLDGSIYTRRGGGHAMTGVGETEDGKIIVSTWGRKYYYEASNRPKERIYGSTLSSSK